MEVHSMFPTTSQRAAAVSADLEAGAVLFSGPAAATEVEAASLLLTASVLALTSTAIEVLAVLGVLIWVVALLVLVAIDASRASHRRHRHQQDRNLYQRRRRDHFWAWR